MVPRRSSKQQSSNGVVEHDGQVPGAKDKAIASLLVADIVMSTGSSLLRSFVERKILKSRYDKKLARQLMKDRSLGQKIATAAATQVATKSVPGAAIVTTGLVAGALYKRGRARKAARRELSKPAED